MTTGASFGAYHAVTFALRYPQLVGRVIGMSGLYDIREQTDGYSDDTDLLQQSGGLHRERVRSGAAGGDQAHGHHLRDRARRLHVLDQRDVLADVCGRRASGTRCASGMAGRTTGRGGSE